jgi:hypothetical protein
MLTAWFTLNTENSVAKLHKYGEIPESYTYYKVNGKWTRRLRKSNTIGRLPILNIGHGVKWFLSLLVLHNKGVVIFQDLITHETVLYNTFRKATNYQMPHQIRVSFCSILAFGSFLNPLAVYNIFEESLSLRLTPPYNEF